MKGKRCILEGLDYYMGDRYGGGGGRVNWWYENSGKEIRVPPGDQSLPLPQTDAPPRPKIKQLVPNLIMA